MLTKVLDERPADVVDVFEDISKETKRSQFTSSVDTVQDKIDRSTEVALCQIQEKLFKVCSVSFHIINFLVLFYNASQVKKSSVIYLHFAVCAERRW